MDGYLVTKSSQSPLQQAPNIPSTPAPRRVRRDVTNTSNNSTTSSDKIGIVTNPFMCLEIGSSVLFKVELNKVNRSLSHYPRYNKDHLFNQNDRFDYGNFRLLHSLVQETNKTISLFANVFNEAGVFVFYDSAEPSREIIIKVTKVGEKCSNEQNNELLQTSGAVLTSYRVTKSKVSKQTELLSLLLL